MAENRVGAGREGSDDVNGGFLRKNEVGGTNLGVHTRIVSEPIFRRYRKVKRILILCVCFCVWGLFVCFLVPESRIPGGEWMKRRTNGRYM